MTEPTAAGAAIRALDLERRFGDLTAVRGVSLEVPRGCVFALLGPNGAGKSTTVRMLTGLLPPTSGSAEVEGLSVRADALEVKRRIGVVADRPALFEELTLRENLTLVGGVHGLSKAETESRAADLLKVLDLSDRRDAFARDASHGMRKKTALAMALIHAPSVLFLDEPFEGIDPVSARRIRHLLTRVTGRGGTVFLTSHVLEIVERLADQVAILAAGSIRAELDSAAIREGDGALQRAFLEAVGEDAPPPEISWLA